MGILLDSTGARQTDEQGRLMLGSTGQPCNCGCCCAGHPPSSLTVGLAGVQLIQGCSPIIYYHWVNIIQATLAGSFTLTPLAGDFCVWQYRESPGTTVQADAYYGLYGCAGDPDAHYDFVIQARRIHLAHNYEDAWHLIAYLGFGDVRNVILFCAAWESECGSSSTGIANQLDSINNWCRTSINVPARGTDGTCSLTPHFPVGLTAPTPAIIRAAAPAPAQPIDPALIDARKAACADCPQAQDLALTGVQCRAICRCPDARWQRWDGGRCPLNKWRTTT